MSEAAKHVSLAKLTLDVMAQPRVRTREKIAAEYGERMQAGDKFPPAVAFSDGKIIWLADGWHRYAAAVGIGSSKLLCEVRKGGLRDAILYAVGANDTHGLKRTNKDKRKAVLTLLHDEEWSQWSDSEIGRRCRVDDQTVASIRASLEKSQVNKRRYRTKHGTVAEMDTAAIGKAQFKEEFERTAHVSRAVIDILEATRKLPEPIELAALFRWPDQYTVSDFAFVRDWFATFITTLEERTHARAA